MQEEWKNLGPFGFSNYSISDLGRVLNQRTNKVMQGTLNPQGFVKVAMLNDDGYRATMSTTPLVAHNFVPGFTEIFNTPIHKDGNKQHNFASNLEWRPRWYAIKYHKQFAKRIYFYDEPLIDVHSGETFPDSLSAVVKYGILEIDIMLSVANDKEVWPTGQKFKRVE